MRKRGRGYDAVVMDSKHGEALRQLLQQATLPENQVHARLERALDAGYWRALNPRLSIGADAQEDRETVPLAPSVREKLLRGFREQGYFQTGPFLAQALVERMKECVEVLKREDWPPVFAFVYDEFWGVTRSPSLDELLSRLLGQGYRQTCHVWVYYVRPVHGAGGWPPHVDGSSHMDRLTVWIPLSDATLDNGCMYLVPKDGLAAATAEKFSRGESLDFSEVGVLLQNSRALPAEAGSVLCWDYGTIHWGSKCGQAQNPRISMGVSFIGEGTQPTSKEPPLCDPHSPLPPFGRRLHVIGKAIATYQRREPLIGRYLDVARRLVEAVGAA